MFKNRLIIPLLLVTLGLYVAYTFLYPSASWRYRMTVTVETPEGLKTGSAVREVKMYSEPHLMPAAGGTFYGVAKGEAVTVDLGKHGILFALMLGRNNDPDYGHMIALDALSGKEKGQQVQLSLDQYPIFIRFKDPHQSQSIEVVFEPPFLKIDRHGDRQYLYGTNRLERAFGPGVRIKEVSMELTGEPVTEEVQKYLPMPFDTPYPFNRNYFQRGTIE